MTEWILIIVVFWGWFFADSLHASRRPRFLVSRASSCRRARAKFGAVLFGPPLPGAWQIAIDDLPYSFSPDGICNVSVLSASHQAPDDGTVRAWRWEDIREISQKRGRIRINGDDFCAVSSFANAASLQLFVQRCVALPSAERETFLRNQLARWFRPASLKRRLLSVNRRTRDIATLGFVNGLLAALLSVYFLTDSPTIVGEQWAARIAAALPLLGGYFALLHVSSLVLAWRAHRRLRPRHHEERSRIILNALLMPPQAMRLRAQIIRHAFAPQHVLTWLAAAGRRDDFAFWARRALRDLRWPRALPPGARQSPVAHISAWMRQNGTLCVETIIAREGFLIETFLPAPRPDGPQSCLYCPRCLAQFTQQGATCPHDIKLLALK